MNRIPAWRLKRAIAAGHVFLGGRPKHSPGHCVIDECPAKMGPLDDPGRDLFVRHVFKGCVCRSCAVEIRTRQQPGGALVTDKTWQVGGTINVRKGETLASVLQRARA